MRILNISGEIQSECEVGKGCAIKNITTSSDYRNILVQLSDDETIFLTLDFAHQFKVLNSCSIAPRQIFIPALKKYSLIVSDSGTLSFIAIEKSQVLRTFETGTDIVTAAASSVTHLCATGSKTGFIRIYDISNINEVNPTLIFRERIHTNSAMKISFDPTGTFMASTTNDGNFYLYDVKTQMNVIGYTNLVGTPQAVYWALDEEDKDVHIN